MLDLRADERTIAEQLALLDEPLARMSSLTEQVSAFASIAGAVRRQSSDAEWLIERLGGVSTSLPPDTHLHRIVLSREGVFTITAHGPDALVVVAALDAWWPGSVRLGGAPEFEDAADGSRSERFSVILENAK